MMGAAPLSPVLWLAAALPIAVVLVLMVGFRLGGTKAGPVGWLVALLVAVTAFGAGPELLLYSQVKAVLLSLFVLYIIWFALALYHVVREAGALDAFSVGIARLTADRTMQLLALGWVFASFLQGVTGFGVPVAVVAPLLVGLGFPAVTAVVATGIAHGWAVTFGSMASSFYAMIAVTGIDGHALAPWSAALLGLACFPCGLAAATVYRGRVSAVHALPAVLVLAVAMGGVQYVLAVSGLWSLAAFGGGIAGLLTLTVIVRLPRYRGSQQERADALDHAEAAGPTMPLGKAASAYLILLAVVLIAAFVTPVSAVLGRVRIAPVLPETATTLGWVNPAGPARAIEPFGHAGALILYTCVLAYLVYRAMGCYSPGAAGRIVRSTVRGSVKPTIGILFMVGMALVMAESGMTYALAAGLSRAMGPVYPSAAPFIGALGAFMTGSNTNSNVLFAPLQQRTAELLGLNVLLILGAQNLGGAVGSVFAPAKVIVGCSTVGLAGEEGDVLRRTLGWGLLIVALGGLLVLLISTLSAS